MNRDLHSIRRDYQFDGLLEEHAGNDPLALFDTWLEKAIEASPDDPTAMVLSTVDSDGWPHSRVVLLKQRNDSGFSFFTNYDSEKGQQLALNNKASMTFFWPALSRQVRIEGTVEKVARDVSESYFASRPRGSQLAARTSKQSAIIANREVLQAAFNEEEQAFHEQEVPCPENWGGYVLKPKFIEFWQGRPSRLHDRICFTQQDSDWLRTRKAP
ncbi:pyridoxamine 5'-phosphate oxidase [Marinomonas sp. M1K-6]|uniref:Pyridoxine/pyridoxamine 5'-phosphate oxidase n=1 Tax=Marinomonas profundi TaxID=2726122 RepID=A0A847RBL1_9GAMM|nr:pyridoxamine 5'-phosphate oxidase [Marinomonas profundi]NLQ18374.1 pyridoxamine 5'-phosphate oxidase [Marinomonas profundi]UDV02433.1 pyridoxamine 5'-phosphate oxidase [Marinomonas profundi]